MKVDIRFVSFDSRPDCPIYLRKEDVALYLYEMAGAEETDVRIRLQEAAKHINSIGKEHGNIIGSVFVSSKR